MLEKAKVATKKLLKKILLRTQNGKRRDTEKVSVFLRECINDREQNVARNMDGEDHSGEVLGGTEEDVIGR